MTDDERIALNIEVAKALGTRAEWRECPQRDGWGKADGWVESEGWTIGGFLYDDTDEVLAWRQHGQLNDYATDPARILEVQAAVIERFGIALWHRSGCDEPFFCELADPSYDPPITRRGASLGIAVARGVCGRLRGGKWCHGCA